MADHKNIHEAMLAVYGAVGYIRKDAEVKYPGTRFRHVSESAAKDAVRKALLDHDVYTTGEAVEFHEGTHLFGLKVVLTLTHAPSGTSVELSGYGGGAVKSVKGVVDDKIVYKSMTGGVRHALLTNFLIASGDDPEQDPDKYERPEGGPQPKPASGNGQPQPEDGKAKAELVNRLVELSQQARSYGTKTPDGKLVWEQVRDRWAATVASDEACLAAIKKIEGLLYESGPDGEQPPF